MNTENDLGKKVIILSHQIRRHLDQISKEYEITGVQSRVLNFICANSCQRAVYQKDIEDEFHIRRSTATGILKLMEKNGLIKKESVPEDARLKKLTLTSRGAEYGEKMYQRIVQMEHQISSGLTEEEAAMFRTVLEKISRNIEN